MFEQFWNRIKKANPKLESSASLTLTIEQFRKQLHNAYRQGFEDGNEHGESQQPPPNIFGSIFRGR